MSFDRFWVSVNHKVSKSLDCCIFEWMLKSSQIVKDTSQSPHINWERIQLMLNYFRSEVNRSSNSCRNELV